VGDVDPATEYIERTESWSPVHKFVADHGKATSRANIEHTHLGGRDVTLDE
jgi:hypothetical protein